MTPDTAAVLARLLTLMENKRWWSGDDEAKWSTWAEAMRMVQHEVERQAGTIRVGELVTVLDARDDETRATVVSVQRLKPRYGDYQCAWIRFEHWNDDDDASWPAGFPWPTHLLRRPES